MNLIELVKEFGEEEDHHRVSLKRHFEAHLKSWMNDCNESEPASGEAIAVRVLDLNADDGFFIKTYTGSCSSWVNSEKRNGQPHFSECKKNYADGLEIALRKLPAFEGTVWRMEEADEEFRKFKWFKKNIGLTISIPYFLSTSKENWDNSPMIWNINTINKGSGRDISSIANDPQEQEVLFLPKSKFRIKGVANDNKTVYMEELDPDAKTEFELCGVYDMTQEDYDKLDRRLGMFD